MSKNQSFLPNISKRLGCVLLLTISAVTCKTGSHFYNEKALPEDRKVIGPALPYDPLTENESMNLLASASMRERREAAWSIVRKLVDEVPISTGAGLDNFKPEVGKKMPRWQTWYESDELRWMFSELYRYNQDNSDNKPIFCPNDITNIFQKHANRPLSFRFPPERFNQRLSQLKNQEQVRGLSGTGVTLFSPGIFSHYLENWHKVTNCVAPESNVKRPSQSNASHCFDAEFPNGRDPVFGSYKARLLDDFSSFSPLFKKCGDFDFQDSSADEARKKIGGAVAIKTTWQRVNKDSELGFFNTDAKSLASHLERAFWRPDGFIKAASLDDSKIYGATILPVGKTIATNDSVVEADLRRYQLTGLHIVTKDTRDWTWITLWWSDKPNEDFGADRPDCNKDNAAEDCLSGPWQNYKMCVVSGYREASTAGYDGLPASLAEALSVAQRQSGEFTWCTNPYIEGGIGNARTNCIGCHQHAGADINPDDLILAAAPLPEILGADRPQRGPGSLNHLEVRKLYPNGGLSQVRENFPGDYLWSFSHGPDYFRATLKELFDENRQ